MGEKERSLLYELSKVRPGQVLGIDSAVRAMDQALAAEETPCVAAWGKFENGRNGLLVATDLRLVGLDKGLLSHTANIYDIPYDMIRTVSHKVGLAIGGEISIVTFPSGGLSFRTYNDKAALDFANWIRNRVGVRTVDSKTWRGEATTLTSLGRVVQNSPADELTKLAALRESGALTEAEFLSAKKRILNS